MYSLDINFLRDRDLTDTVVPDKASGGSSAPPGKEPTPLIIGGAITAVCLAGAGFLFWQESNAQASIEEETITVDQEIQRLTAQGNTIEGLEADIAAAKNRSAAFVNVLQTRIKPWSAIMQEVGDLTPGGLQLSSFEQTDDQLLIKGFSQGFTEVNDLMINLQASPLFVEEDVYIVSAALVDSPVPLEFPRPVESFNIPKVVEYTISVSLGDLSDSEIIQTLEEQGAKGMAERLKTSF